MVYKTDRLILKTLSPENASSLEEYFRRNRAFLAPWEPVRDIRYYSRESLSDMIRAEELSRIKGDALRLYLFLPDSERIIGFTAITSILYGAFQSCFLGYKLDKDEINRGYMTEALKKIIQIAFEEYGLHRIESNVMPSNTPSRRVMQKLHFSEEGLGREYLKIAGKWEDHIHYVLLNRQDSLCNKTYAWKEPHILKTDLPSAPGCDPSPSV